jgi:uncharacterized protein
MRRNSKAADEVVQQLRGEGCKKRSPRQQKDRKEHLMRNIHGALVLSTIIGLGCVLCAAQTGQSGEGVQPAGQAQAAPMSTIPIDQQATKEQLAKLFEVMRIRGQMQSMKQIVPAMIQQQIQTTMSQTEAALSAGKKLTPEQRAAMEKVMNKYVGKAMDLYPPDEMVADMTVLYQQHLSRDDVDGMIAFYNSPAGQHLLDAQPVIAREYMPLVMSRVTERSKVMMKEMMKEMAEIVPTEAQQGSAKPTTK